MPGSKHLRSSATRPSKAPPRYSRRTTAVSPLLPRSKADGGRPTADRRRLSSPHRPVRFPLQLAVADRVAFVVQLLALDERDLRLRARPLEVEREGDAGDAPGRDGARPAFQLAPVQQQLPVPFGGVVRPGGGAVGRDVHADQVGLPGAELNVRILELRASFAKRLDLRARQHEACFGPVLDEILVKSLAVGGDRLSLLFFLRGRLPPRRVFHSSISKAAGRRGPATDERINSQKRRASSGSNCIPPLREMISRAASGEIAAR